MTWSGGISTTTEAFKAALGEPATVVADSSEFERRLLAAAPRARDFLKARAATTSKVQQGKLQGTPRRATPGANTVPKRHK